MTRAFDSLAPGVRARLVVRAAAQLADEAMSHARERMIAANTTGLSPEGVALAFEHLETTMSEREEALLIASVTPAKRVHVILSANVFIAAARAIALAVVAAPDVVVRPSKREPTFARMLVDEAAKLGAGAHLQIADEPIAPGDHVHAYGRDETCGALRRTMGEATPIWFHGTGFGIAVRDGNDATRESDAEALARDVVVFDQRGCLSPRVMFAIGDELEASRFAAALAEQLAEQLVRIPLGIVEPAERVAVTSYQATLAAVGEIHGELGALVGFDPAPRALLWPAAPRAVHVVCVRTAADAEGLLAPLARGVTTLVGQGASADALARTLPLARRAAFGHAQRPPLDGPVDRRTPALFADGPRES